ncbi:Gfo/Idh/MocA family protein [Proteiniclasticum sp. C24MP]|uniref:Gfo/Idh/MocA family protein n=1 Tax=Proteiniclasticum sp. C24MP TaxID=3374101 RepID=UPI0037550C7E
MVRIGIAGIGQIAEDYISLFADGKISEGRITALSSRNQERVKGIIDTYALGDIRTFSCLEEMLKKDVVDAVIITTPHTLHPAMAELVLESGKNVLVDKPLGIKASELTDLVKLAEEKPHLVSAVMLNRRSSDLYQKVKDIAGSGELGELRRALWQITNLYRTYAYYGTSTWRGTYLTEGGGVLMNQAVHQLDLLLWIIGMPEKAHAFMKEGFHRPMTTENDVILNLFYESGARATFLASTHESPGTNRLELSFDKGQIVVEEDRSLKITRLTECEEDFAKKERTYFTHVPCEVERFEMPSSSNKVEQARTINNFIGSILGKEKVMASFSEGLKSVQVINSAYLSSWSGKTVDLNYDPEEYDLYWNRKLEE